jgi:cell fate (sporulation/competence/biofilm development) regulator YlbF (YheA/YmcA/DUF963 family)
MPTQIEENPVTQKTRELCQAIVDLPNLRAARQQIDAFLSNETARGQYEVVMSKGQALQEKQQNSVPLDGTEIADFEKHRDALLANPVARGVLDAQEEIHHLQHSIQKYVSKTLETGRVPTAEDLSDSCGGHGSCGCHEH